jgi:hypothetical protein
VFEQAKRGARERANPDAALRSSIGSPAIILLGDAVPL